MQTHARSCSSPTAFKLSLGYQYYSSHYSTIVSDSPCSVSGGTKGSMGLTMGLMSPSSQTHQQKDINKKKETVLYKMCIFVQCRKMHILCVHGWIWLISVCVCVWVWALWVTCVQLQRSVKEESIIISCTVPTGQMSRWSMADTEVNHRKDERHQVTFGSWTGYFGSHFPRLFGAA